MSLNEKSQITSLREQISKKDVLLRIEAVKSLQNYGYDEAAPILLEALHDHHYSVRSTAVEVLGAFDNKGAVSLILPSLKDAHYEVRYIAAETLGLMEARESVSYLIDSLKDTDAIVRINAALSLGRLSAKEAIPALLSCLADRDELVRGYAAEAIGEIGEKTTINALENALKEETRNASRVRILAALYKLGKTAILSSIVKLLNTKSYRVRCATAHILEELANTDNTSDIIAALEKRLEKEQTVAVQSTIIRCLTQLKRSIEDRPR